MRGLITVLMVPMIALAARRVPQWSLNVFVSRHVAFYITTFMVVGAYLLLMAGVQSSTEFTGRRAGVG